MADIVAKRIRQMIARGELSEGDWLPTEPELMTRFGVSRPTLREAFRLLEADSLIRIRRGPPGGARVTVPGPEAAAPMFGLLLTLSGTTVNDVYEARMVIEPPAARRLAEHGTDEDHEQLADEVEKARAALDESDAFGRETVRFHQRMVELAGNHTLAVVIGTLSEVITQHIDAVYHEGAETLDEIAKRQRRALRAYERLVALVRTRDGAAAEEFWAKHMRAARSYLLKDTKAAQTQVLDVLG
jgi:DNA-binding FadR family transcriptional regulator